MKRALLLISALILSGCSNPEPVAVKGEVVSCGAVTSDKAVTEGISLECVDGSEGALIESLRGPMILNVWGSWCTSCKAEMPEFVSFYSKAKDKVQLVGVAVEEAKPQDAKDFVVRNGITWPNLIDTQGSSRSYFGMGVPVTWFIDKAGVVTFKKSGEIKSEKELVTLTNKYLGVDLS